MVIWSKNKQGWKDLISLVSQTNHPDYFYYKPRIYPWNCLDASGKFQPGLEMFLKGNIAGCSGHHGSHLSDNLFCDLYGDQKLRHDNLRKAYAQHKNYKTEDYKRFLKPDWLESTCELALKFEKMFGKGNFWIELQNELNPKDELALWIHPLIVDCLRKVSKETGIPAFASSDPHYPKKEDAESQRATVMIAMKETDQSITEKMSSSDEMDLMVFFGSSEFYLHSYEEMSSKFTKEELEESNKITDQIEEYSTMENPKFPDFDIPTFPENLSYLKGPNSRADKYLLYRCVEGAKKIQPWINSNIPKEKYWQRLGQETKIIFEFGLSSYFLVVQDICNAADFKPADNSFDWRKNLEQFGKTDPIARGIGRGSAANCLISYFLGITGIDPIRHNLVFSRFLNAGRMSKDKISLPDVDIDFSVEGRDWIVDYIRNKYGHDKVGQILTYHSIKGRGAIKDLFRIRNVPNGFDVANEICNYVAQEHVIADEIEHRIKDGDESFNILKWTLENSIDFQKYYNDPKYKDILDQAIKCEGVKRGTGKHPSGVVIANDKLENLFPMVYDPRGKERIVGFDLKSAESCGANKYDILGVAVLSKLSKVERLVNKRKNV